MNSIWRYYYYLLRRHLFSWRMLAVLTITLITMDTFIMPVRTYCQDLEIKMSQWGFALIWNNKYIGLCFMLIYVFASAIFPEDLFKCICGFYQVTNGEILINKNVVGIGDKMPGNIAFTIEEPAFLGEYSGRKKLEFLYELRHKRNSEHIKNVMEKVNLDYYSKKRVAKYSLGMKQRLAIAQVLMEDEPILIMDEPMNGLDREGINDIRKLILEEKKKGKIILLASHNSGDIEYLCDEVYELENGKVIGRGTK